MDFDEWQEERQRRDLRGWLRERSRDWEAHEMSRWRDLVRERAGGSELEPRVVKYVLVGWPAARRRPSRLAIAAAIAVSVVAIVFALSGSLVSPSDHLQLSGKATAVQSNANSPAGSQDPADTRDKSDSHTDAGPRDMVTLSISLFALLFSALAALSGIGHPATRVRDIGVAYANESERLDIERYLARSRQLRERGAIGEADAVLEVLFEISQRKLLQLPSSWMSPARARDRRDARERLAGWAFVDFG